jgi:hypothetical protein
MKVVHTFLFLLVFRAASFAQDFAYNNFDLNQPKVEQAAVASKGDFDNNVRFFAIAQGENEKNFSNINFPLKARYNLNPSAIVFNGNSGLNTITVNKSGLYHIEGYFNMITEMVFGGRRMLQIFMFQFTGLQAPNSPAHLLFAEEMVDCKTCGRNTGLRASNSFSLEVHIEAGQKIAFMPVFSPNGLLTGSYQFHVRGHLINE